RHHTVPTLFPYTTLFRSDRLPPVLATLYLIYTEGHTATTGDSLTRADLSMEAIRLARVLTDLMPDEPEAVGLLALMLLTEARRPDRKSTRLNSSHQIISY